MTNSRAGIASRQSIDAPKGTVLVPSEPLLLLVQAHRRLIRKVAALNALAWDMLTTPLSDLRAIGGGVRSPRQRVFGVFQRQMFAGSSIH
jgi:hypothetical protein